MNKLETKYWESINKARQVDFDLNKIHKKDKQKEENKRKVLKAIYIGIHNKEILEAGCILYQKNAITRLFHTQLMKYYIKSFDINSDSSEKIDLLICI